MRRRRTTRRPGSVSAGRSCAWDLYLPLQGCLDELLADGRRLLRRTAVDPIQLDDPPALVAGAIERREHVRQIHLPAPEFDELVGARLRARRSERADDVLEVQEEDAL